jgi:hypothetical protein
LFIARKLSAKAGVAVNIAANTANPSLLGRTLFIGETPVPIGSSYDLRLGWHQSGLCPALFTQDLPCNSNEFEAEGVVYTDIPQVKGWLT